MNFHHFLTFIMIFNFGLSQDIVLSLDGNNMNYESNADVAGFQFDHDGCVTAASGGDAQANGFMISVGGSTVIAFSLSGSVIPSGSGTLLVLDGSPTQTCINNFIFSNSDGVALTVEWDEGEPPPFIEGCNDPSAINYDSDSDGCNEGDAEDFSCCEYQGGGGLILSFGEVNDNTNTIEIIMESTVDVAGFQFDITGPLNLTGASGGSAEENGFMVSTSSTTLIGFSLSGAVIPPGSGVLTVLTYDDSFGSDSFCIENGVVSNSNGESIPIIYGDCFSGSDDVLGCTDESACNYNPDANDDDGSCEYAEGTCDCDGNPVDD